MGTIRIMSRAKESTGDGQKEKRKSSLVLQALRLSATLSDDDRANDCRRERNESGSASACSSSRWDVNPHRPRDIYLRKINRRFFLIISTAQLFVLRLCPITVVSTRRRVRSPAEK